MAYGYTEGDVCGRDGCCGVIAIRPSENCSCHISPPCSSCTAAREYCPECGHVVEEGEDDVMNDFVVDLTEIDWPALISRCKSK